MIRILHIVSSLTENGGVMSVIMNYYKHIDRNRIQFDFLYFEENPSPFVANEIELLGGHIYYVPKPSLKKTMYSFELFNNFFKKNAYKYSVIHLHEIYLVHFIRYFKAKYLIKHLIVHAHLTKYSDNPISAFRNRFMCINLNNSATDFFACSQAAGNFYFGQKGKAKTKIRVIKNAIDLEKYSYDANIRDSVRKSMGLENKFVIGHIGRLMPQKNQLFLLDIFKEIKCIRKNSVLLLIGDGELKEEIISKIERLKIMDSVKLLGIRNDVDNMLQAMDAFLLPSLFEGLGIVAIEAQANGLPCVLSDTVPGEVNMGGCLFLPLSKSHVVWAKELLQYVDSIGRRNYYSNLIDQGYSIKEAANILGNIYLELAKE